MTETKNYCTNCGKEMNEQAEICTSCGVRKGKVINYCYSCGGEVKPEQEMCLGCGVNPRKAQRSGGIQAAVNSIGSSSAGKVNPTLAAILGFFLPGLPQILWLNQKTKGIVMLVVDLLFCWTGITVIASAVIGCMDAYQLSNRVNKGEQLGEWTFFWSK